MLNLDIYDALRDGAWITITVSATAIVWGTIVAVLFGVASLSPFAPLRWVVRIYVEIFRGVSAIILLFWVYYSLPILGIELTTYQAAVLALGLNLAAYGTEIVRGAIQAIPKGQTEGAIAINLSGTQRTWSVILPQAAVTMLPPYGNLLIEVMKASSLVSLIGVADIMFEYTQLRGNRQAGYDAVDLFLATLVLYFVISFCLTLVIRMLERRFGRGLETGHMARTVK